jgi:hypothetical protein
MPTQIAMTAEPHAEIRERIARNRSKMLESCFIGLWIRVTLHRVPLPARRLGRSAAARSGVDCIARLGGLVNSLGIVGDRAEAPRPEIPRAVECVPGCPPGCLEHDLEFEFVSATCGVG